MYVFLCGGRKRARERDEVCGVLLERTTGERKDGMCVCLGGEGSASSVAVI